jgi:hypothetical protein
MNSSPNSSEKQAESVGDLDRMIEGLGREIQRIEEENESISQRIGLSHHQIQDILDDRTRYPAAVNEELQKQRQALKDSLERCIDAIRTPLKKHRPPTAIGGHWIFVR